MADDTTSLSVSITGDASSAVTMSDELSASLQQLIEREAQLVASMRDATAAVTNLSERHVTGAASAKEHAEAESVLGSSLGKVETATNAAARAMGALGLATGEASERVLSFSEALEAVGGTAGSLLAVGAAFLAIGEATNLFADGLKDVAKEQADFATLEVAVKQQGESWDEAKESIEHFAEALQASTIYSKGEGISAVRELALATGDWQYAEHMVSVAADVAAGTHKSLTEVVDRLRQAIAGHNRGLLELDPTLAALVARHASLQEIVDHLAETFEGQAVRATKDLSGATAQLGNDVHQLGNDLADFVSGPLGGMIRGLDDAVRAMHAFGAGLSEARDADLWNANLGAGAGANVAFGGNAKPGAVPKPTVDVNEPWYAQIFDMSGQKPEGDATKPAHPVNMAADEEAQRKAAEQQNEAIRERIELVGELYRTGRMGYDEAKRQEEELATRYKLTTTQLADLNMATLHLDDERKRMADEAARRGAAEARRDERAAGRASFDFQPGDEPDVKGDDKYATSQKALEQTLGDLKEREDAKADATRRATSAQAEAIAKTDEANEKTKDATIAIDNLVLSLTQMERQRVQLEAAEKSESAAADVAWKTYVDYGNALEHVAGGPSEKQKQALADLHKNFEALHTAAGETSQKISELTGFINSDTSALREWDQVLSAAPDDLAARWRSFNEEVTKGLELLDDPTKLNEVKAQRAADDQMLQEELATYGLSLNQQLAYYQHRYANLIAADEQYTDEGTKAYKKIEDLELQSYEDREKQYDAFIQNVDGKETTFLNDIIQKHEALHTALKDVFTGIENDFVSMIDKMLIQGPLLGKLDSELASMFGVPGAAGGFATAGGIAGGTGGSTSSLPLGATASYGTFGALFGTAGAQSIIGQIPTDGGLLSVLTGDNAIGEPTIALGGGSTATSGLASSLGMGTKDTTGGAQQTILGEVATGAGLGSALGGVGGDETTSAIGGAVGSVIGSVIGKLGGAAGGPLGSAIGSLVGGLIGGFFGPNYGPPSNYPDRSQPGYGQWLVDYQGAPATVNGQNVNPDPQYWEALGGTSLEASIGSWVTANASNSNLPQPLEALLQQFEALGGTDPGRDLGIKSEYNGIDTLWSGAQIPVTQLEQLTTEFQDLIGNTGAAVYDITAAYPNYSGTGNPAGYWQNGKWISGGPATGPGSTGTVVSTSATGSATTPTGGTVNVTINGNVVGPGGLQSIAGEIATAIARFENGEISGSSANNGITPAVVGN